MWWPGHIHVCIINSTNKYLCNYRRKKFLLKLISLMSRMHSQFNLMHPTYSIWDKIIMVTCTNYYCHNKIIIINIVHFMWLLSLTVWWSCDSIVNNNNCNLKYHKIISLKSQHHEILFQGSIWCGNNSRLAWASSIQRLIHVCTQISRAAFIGMSGKKHAATF